MASKIVPGNVDGTYPKAGQDNSSQGFRDNFTAIKNNFTEAKSEIEDMQTNKASLNQSSNFNNNEVLQAKFKDTSEVVFAHGTTGGAITLNHNNGHYQTITTNASVTLSLTNFPSTGQLGRIVLDINDQNSEFSKGKKKVGKNIFLARPYGDKIDCYCIETEEEFVDLVKDYFLIKDSGYSCHKLFGRRINEWIVCGEN